MKKAVPEKFKQNPDLVLLLFQTEAAILRELIPDDVPTDKFLGWNSLTLFENKYGIKLINLISMYHLNLM